MADYQASWDRARNETGERGWGSPLPPGYESANPFRSPADQRSTTRRPQASGAKGDPLGERFARLKAGLLRSLVKTRPADGASLWTGWNLRGRSGGAVAVPRAGGLPGIRSPQTRAGRSRYPESRPAAVGSEASRRVTYVDVYSVAKVSLAFYLILLVVFVVASVLLWLVADAFGAVDSIQKSVRSLFAVKSFVLHPVTIALYTSAFGAVLAVAGTIANVLAATMYNLISEVIGGIRIGVAPDDEVV